MNRTNTKSANRIKQIIKIKKAVTNIILVDGWVIGVVCNRRGGCGRDSFGIALVLLLIRMDIDGAIMSRRIVQVCLHLALGTIHSNIRHGTCDSAIS